MGFSLKKSLKNLTNNPAKWAGNALWEGTGKGFGFGHLDSAMGGSGTFQSTMRNPAMQAGAGLAASFVPGMQWYAPLGLGAGMSLVGGGNTEDQIQGAGMAGLGYAGGNLGQMAYTGLGGLGTTAGTVSAEGAMGPGGATGFAPNATNASNIAVNAPWAPEAVTAADAGLPAFPTSSLGGISLNYPGTDRLVTAEDMVSRGAAGGFDPRVVPRQFGTGAASSTGSGRQTMSRGNLLGLIGAKTGLGYLSNIQAQQAMEPELDERRRAMERIRMLQENPGMAYQDDPGLRALRSRALDTVESRYRAKFGGGEGGAFARDLLRTGAGADRAALNDAIANEYQMLGVTQPALGYNQGAGGTGLGALTGPATGAIGDYALMEFLSSL